MTRHPLRALAGALLAIGVAGSLLTTATAPAGAAPARPQVGDCHSLTNEEAAAVSDPDPRISCERAHNSRTFAVVDLPASAFRDNATFGKEGTRACAPAFDRSVGGSAAGRALSAYTFYLFAPTEAQLKAGARWVRCDLVLLGGQRLLALPTDETPALGAVPHPSSVALCLQVTDTALRFTACSVKHNYRARGAVEVAGTDYPARSRFARIAAERCGKIAGRGWYATWPTRYGWLLAKERHLVCHRATRA